MSKHASAGPGAERRENAVWLVLDRTDRRNTLTVGFSGVLGNTVVEVKTSARTPI